MKLLAPIIFTASLPLTLAAPKDFKGLGHMIAQNMTFNGYGFGDGRDKGCITDSFEWTLNKTTCGIFSASRKGLKYSDQFGNSTYVVLKSRNGICGLGKKQKVVCGKWAGEGPGPLNGRDDDKASLGGNILADAAEVLTEGKWFAHDSNPIDSRGNWLNWEPVAFGKMWFTNFTPTAEKDSSIWNNLDETEPEQGILLDPYTYGVMMYWDSLEK
ncbi:hypothetical protein P154DRAFT_596897 [Amniculicola lignicola CBS 123094]|uniref:Uncharacterized protein n=1 Tax=Amniculicola lignicola CBS 123094 TaxID=1392246 RepID=A0A6A5WQA1_9PLEO|nr:hypothetical protein P154DRAFT_596897 [Amniculicola lignicola CBS 123094]